MKRVVRGRLVWFEDDDQPIVYERGALAVEDGQIRWSGDFSALPEIFKDWPHDDHGTRIITPGFIDPHIHFPQSQVVGSYAGSLLEWLNTYTFIEEQRYGEAAFCAVMANRFLDQLIQHGTTTCVAFASVHKVAASSLLDAAVERNYRLVTGKSMMDRNAPEALLDTAQTSYDDTKDLIAGWHGKGRVEVAITPRFALTSTEAQMEAIGDLVREYPDCLLQTHLSENLAELEAVREAYPSALDYTDVYDRYGHLTSKSLMGHCIHLSNREVSCLAERGSVAVFCPTSNLFLGSGLFDMQRLTDAGVRTAIATDIGGGTSWSMLSTLSEGYKVLNVQGQRWHPFSMFRQATRGNAEAIGMEDRIGSLRAGMEADFIVLDVEATSAMALRAETVTSLEEELFVLAILGDDRAVVEVYIAGIPSKTVNQIGKPLAGQSYSAT